MYFFGNRLSGTSEHYFALQHKVTEANVLINNFKHYGGLMYGIFLPDIL